MGSAPSQGQANNHTALSKFGLELRAYKKLNPINEKALVSGPAGFFRQLDYRSAAKASA